MPKVFYLAVLFLSFQSCNRVLVQQKLQHTTQKSIMLASIGSTSGNVVTRDFKSEVFPKYKHAIRVTVNYAPFTQLNYKAYKKATKQQQVKNVFTYDKDAENKTYFLEVQLADTEQLIAEINAEANQKVNAWLQNNPKAKLVTGLSMYLPQKTLGEIKKAEKILLVNRGYKEYTLELYKNNKPYKSISFSEGVIFGYSLSNFCWGQTRGVNWEIKALVKEYNNCPKGQYKSHRKAVKSNEVDFNF